MAKANRECHTCSTKYYYCPTCPDDSRNPRIYVMWCGERCAKIFNLLSDETFNNITTAECKEELSKLNITEKDNFKDSIKRHIQRVMESESKANEVEVIEEVNTDESIIEAAIDATETTEFVDVADNVTIVDDVIKTTNNNFNYKKRNKKYRNSEVD